MSCAMEPMEQQRIDELLDRLAPVNTLKPTKVRKDMKVVLDDTVFTEDTKNMFVNGFQDESKYTHMTAEKLSTRFLQGLQLFDTDSLSNVNHLAYWKPSSYKVGNPIDHALDDNPESFWQSDGIQPHQLDISFSKRMDIVMMALYFSLIADESYTPRLVKIYVGHSPSDALFYKTLEVRNVNGWVALTFEDNRSSDSLLKCQFIRIVFPVNHENGKDTHLRGIRVFGSSKKMAVETSEWMQSLASSNRLITQCALR
ncbi:DOC1 (YGL240W) [Zygosaccharomyces parabailii]|nr:DOC1 (YGL240W) [Zygosaccharomyces parabailii]